MKRPFSRTFLAVAKRFAIVLLFLVPLLAHADVTLRFTSWDGDVALRILRSLIHQFEQENPGIHVVLEQIPDYNEYHQKMIVEYAANAAPDVTMMDPQHFQFLAERGALLPLNQFFKDTPGFSLKNYYPPIVKAHSLNGKLYVLPRDIAPEGLIFVNKKLFKEAGLPIPDGSWTWDFQERPWLKNKDFLWVMHQLTKVAPNGKVTQFGFTPGWDQLFLNTLAYSYGLRYTDDPQHPTKVLPDISGWIKVANFQHDIEWNKKWAPNQSMMSNALQTQAYQLFVAGKTAMYQDGIWQVPSIRNAMHPYDKGWFDWDVVPFPRYARAKELHTPTGGSGYGIFSSCRHPEAAWKFVTFMAGPVGMRAMAEAGIAQPAMRPVALSTAWVPSAASISQIPALIQKINSGQWNQKADLPLEQLWPPNRIITDREVPDVVVDPTSPYWQDAVSSLNAEMDSMFNGALTPQEALTKGQKLAQDRLDYLRNQSQLPNFDWVKSSIVGVAIVAALLFFIYWPERKIKLSKRKKQENKSAYRFISLWIFGMITLTIGPMIISILMSTTDWDMITPAKARGVGNFVEAFTKDPHFWVSLKVTFIYTMVRVPASIILSFFLALLLNVKVKGIPLYRAAFYIPSLASGVASALIWRKLFATDNGVINGILYSPFMEKTFHIGSFLSSLAGTPGKPVDWIGNEKTALASFILMSLWTVGGSTIIILAGLQGVPDMYYEAATVDGASSLRKMVKITIPLITPALFFTMVTGFIGAFQNFTDVQVITNGTGGPNNATMLYMLNLYNSAFEFHRFGYAAALAWVLFVIILMVTLVQLVMNKYVYYESDSRS